MTGKDFFSWTEEDEVLEEKAAEVGMRKTRNEFVLASGRVGLAKNGISQWSIENERIRYLVIAENGSESSWYRK